MALSGVSAGRGPQHTISQTRRRAESRLLMNQVTHRAQGPWAVAPGQL